MQKLIIITLLYLNEVKSEISKNDIKYPLPYYNEISPCGCDLTENKCDTKCCCDQVRYNKCFLLIFLSKN